MARYPKYLNHCNNYERSRQLSCFICRIFTTKYNKNETWNFHIASPLHRMVLANFNESFYQSSKNRITCKICWESISKAAFIYHAIEHQLTPWCNPPDMTEVFFINYIAKINDQYYCHLCDKQFSVWYSALLHVDNQKHQDYHRHRIDYNIDNEAHTHLDCQLLINHSIFQNSFWIFECMICYQCFFGHQNIVEHINGHCHVGNQSRFINKLLWEQMRIFNHETFSEYQARQMYRMSRTKFNENNFPSNLNVKSCVPVLKNNEESRLRTLKSDGKSDSKKLASPSRQLLGVVHGLKDDGDKVTCEICNKVVQGLTKYHVHLTSHLWQSFTQDCNMNEAPISGVVDKNLPSELNLNNMSVNQPGGDSLNKTGVTSSEIDGLNEQLSRLDISTKGESMLMDHQVGIDDEFDKLDNDESSSHPLLRRCKNFANKKLPTQEDDLKFSYIYEIDEKQLENIQLGTKLSLVLNGTNNIFCMICRTSVRNSVGDIYEHFSSVKHNRYLEQMQSDDLICRTCPGTLSDLQLAREYIEDRSNLHVHCWACSKSIVNIVNILEQHIESDVHKNNCVIHSVNSEKLFKSLQARMSRNWYNVEVYWCIICDKLFSDEIGFINHLSELAHEKKCLYYISEELTFDFCTTCATLWFGFQYSFAYHSQCKMHKYLLKDHHYHLTELPKGTPELLTAPDNFCDELLAEIDCNVDDEKLKEELLMKDLEKIAKEKFPNVMIYPFGSRVSGLGFKDSDLDVFIDCDEWYNKSNISNSIMDYLSAIQKSLKNSDKWTIDRTVIENVRIPIIKTHHKPTGIQCDISFSNGLTIENTKLIKSYIDKYPLCRKLIIFMKTWIKKCNLCGYKGLSSYAVAWMVVFFLQCKKILPSVNELIALKKQSRLIGGWEVGVIEQFEVQSSNQDFMQLLKELFIFYSQFNYKYEVMCPLLGETVEKEKFISLELPTAMNPYIKYLEQKESEKFRVFSTMCLQDPFDLSHNLTKSVSKFTIYQLKTFCFLSAQILENNS